MVPNLEKFIFSRSFAIRQTRACWFQIWQNYFQTSAQKYPNKTFLVPNLGIFAFPRNFAIRHIRSSWFQIWQYFFQIPAQKYPDQAFLAPNFRIFICIKLCKKTNSRMLISNKTKIFSNSSPKIPKSGIFGPKIKDFYFCTRLCNKINSGTQISNMTMTFSNSSPKIPRIFAYWKIQGYSFRKWQ